jgi:hypothetical protein
MIFLLEFKIAMWAIGIWNLLMNAFNNWEGIEEYRNNISQQTRDGNLEANVEELCVCIISATAHS